MPFTVLAPRTVDARAARFVFKLLGALGAFFILATLTIEVAGIALRQLGFSMAGADAYAGYFLAAGSFLALGYALRRRRSHPRHADPAAAARPHPLVDGGALSGDRVALSVYFAYFSAKLVWGSYAFNDVSQNVDATPLWIPQLSMAIGLAGLALAFIEQLVITLRTRPIAARGRTKRLTSSKRWARWSRCC